MFISHRVTHSQNSIIDMNAMGCLWVEIFVVNIPRRMNKIVSSWNYHLNKRTQTQWENDNSNINYTNNTSNSNCNNNDRNINKNKQISINTTTWLFLICFTHSAETASTWTPKRILHRALRCTLKRTCTLFFWFTNNNFQIANAIAWVMINFQIHCLDVCQTIDSEGIKPGSAPVPTMAPIHWLPQGTWGKSAAVSHAQRRWICGAKLRHHQRSTKQDFN